MQTQLHGPAVKAWFQAGYADALAQRPMAILWGSAGLEGHRYGMGYFHGRAHRSKL